MKILIVLLSLFSISCSASLDFQCIDLHDGSGIYEGDDGYGGKVDLSLNGKKITIYHDGLFILSKPISSDFVEISSSGVIRVTVSPEVDYSFYLGRTSSVDYVNTNNVGQEYNGLLCSSNATERQEKSIVDYLKNKLLISSESK